VQLWRLERLRVRRLLPRATASRHAPLGLGAARAAARGTDRRAAARVVGGAAGAAGADCTGSSLEMSLSPQIWCDAQKELVPQVGAGSGRGRAGTKRPCARSDPGGGENGRVRVANASSAPCAAWLPAVASAIAASASACRAPFSP